MRAKPPGYLAATAARTAQGPVLPLRYQALRSLASRKHTLATRLGTPSRREVERGRDVLDLDQAMPGGSRGLADIVPKLGLTGAVMINTRKQPPSRRQDA